MKFQRTYSLGLIIISLIYISCTKNDKRDIPYPTTYQLKLTGNIKACNNSNLTNGYLFIASNNGISSVYISNGFFDTTFEASSAFDSLIVYAIDLDSLKTSDTIIRTVNSDSLNLGIINTCARDVDEYINFKINNEKYVFVPAFYDSLNVTAWDTLNAPTTYIYRNDLGNLLYNCKYHRTQFSGMTAGTFGVNWNSNIHIGRYYSFNMPNTGSITYTSYGSPGSYITGSVYIPFVDNTDSLNYVLTGTFKVRRDR